MLAAECERPVEPAQVQAGDEPSASCPSSSTGCSPPSAPAWTSRPLSATFAVRRRRSVHFEPSDKLFRRPRVARLDNSIDAELRKLLRVDLLIVDDFALAGLDAAATSNFYETVVERHRRASTIITSNRDPSEWLALMTDPLLAGRERSPVATPEGRDVRSQLMPSRA